MKRRRGRLSENFLYIRWMMWMLMQKVEPSVRNELSGGKETLKGVCILLRYLHIS